MQKDNLFRLTERITSWSVFLTLLVTYWLTVPPTVSYWDCPEYVTAATRLEVGHPPGNPVWMLAVRMATMFVPDRVSALAVNLTSGLFTALAGYFLARVIYIGALWILSRTGSRRRLNLIISAGGAAVGSLAFGWCDSVWYSAVEAEVYAMSIFLTSLTLWLMVQWARAKTVQSAWRILILIAYIFGLSLGVHQLNLLVIPAMAMIWAIRRGITRWYKLATIFIISLVATGCILAGMMPSTIALAAELELFAVNTLHMPFLSGVVAYIVLLGASLLLALFVTARSHNRGAMAAAIFPCIFLSGIFIFGGHMLPGAAISAIASLLLVRGHHFLPRRLNLCIWMLAMLLTGYSAYALIPVRGSIPAPPNSVRPDDPFSFASYQAREQYGSAPLLYGHTPYSRPLLVEEFVTDSVTGKRKAEYKRYALRQGHRVMEAAVPGAKLGHSGSARLSAADSALNSRALERGGDAYLVRGYTTSYRLTPELDMWFPRITSRDERDLVSYNDWLGMTPSTMTHVEVSEAVDSAGNPVGRMNADGKREKTASYRPTYLQNLQFMLSYQIGYMYLRYLMWNFSGRQNDIPSQGEVEHGNFITGIPVIDNAMLGAEEALPPSAGRDNPGRNRYYMLPLILGIIGIVWMCRSGYTGQASCAVIAFLFIMTGVAIVVYLNQSPGEPRERDYSFLGSFLAYAIWIGAGAVALGRAGLLLAERFSRRRGILLTGIAAGLALPFFTVFLMLAENIDDHDRSGRRVARSAAVNILNSLDRDAIIFVDGDNATFPLWYAREVEGVRRDVTVINLSYLSSPRYAATLLEAWDGSRPVPSTFSAGDMLYNALISLSAREAADTIADALDAFERLRVDTQSRLGARRLRVVLSPGDTAIVPVQALSRSGKSLSPEFRKMMILDIVAANAASGNPRPIYWQSSIGGDMTVGLDRHLSPGLFARRLGGLDDMALDNEFLRGVKTLEPYNDRPDAYMDRVPASRLATQRAALTRAIQRLTRRRHTDEALKTARFAMAELSHHHDSYLAVRNADTLFLTGKEYASALRELADTLRAREAKNGARYGGVTAELRREADFTEARADSLTEAWHRYRKALPPRLRLKMVPSH